MLVIHIGFAKTGTTFLQKRVFPVLSGTHYLGLLDPSKAVSTFLDELAIAVCGASDPDPDEIGRAITSRMRAGINIASNEGLLRPYQTARGAERLRRVTRGLDVRILITIRKQDSLIWSRFVHDRARTKNLFPAYTLDQALTATGECAWPYCRRRGSLVSCVCAEAGFKRIPLDYYDYHKVAGIYADVFGIDNVHVIPLECFGDTDRLCTLLEQGVGVPIDPAARSKISQAPRENVQDTLAGLQSEKEGTLARLDIMKHYYASNARLSHERNLGLEQYGYIGGAA